LVALKWLGLNYTLETTRRNYALWLFYDAKNLKRVVIASRGQN